MCWFNVKTTVTRQQIQTNKDCFRKSDKCDSQMSMSADASLPVGPKWILMNFPWGAQTQTRMLFVTQQQQHFLFSSSLSRHNHIIKLTKREELSLRIVLALPNASMAGLASMIWSSKDPWIHRERLKDCTHRNTIGYKLQWSLLNKETTYSFFHMFPQSSDESKVLYHPLGVDCFPCARLSADRTTQQTERLSPNNTDKKSTTKFKEQMKWTVNEHDCCTQETLQTYIMQIVLN